jgi:triphosphoribosyl-dephospho-CoA synthase
VTVTTTAAPAQDQDARALEPRVLGDLAAGALRAEAALTPKPGLVDQRGSGAHGDMDLAMFLRSAVVLRPWFTTLAHAAASSSATSSGDGLELRRELGRIGRSAEADMLAATGDVNTHRGAIFSLGFLVAGATRAMTTVPAAVTRAAAELARLPDVTVGQARSHGDLVRDQRPGVGAAPHAAAGFPVTMRTALPALRAARDRGATETVARLDALLAVMAVLDDTCVLYRGGAAGLERIQRGATAVLAAGGAGTPLGRRLLLRLDDQCHAHGLSPGGTADILATALFLDLLNAMNTWGTHADHEPYL